MKVIARLILLLGVAVLVVRVTAQAPAPAPTVPPLTADEQAMLALVVSLRNVANTACQDLDAFKQYNEATARVAARIEANHPKECGGPCTVNWATMGLVAKTPPPKR